jgi:hypothetical protein
MADKMPGRAAQTVSSIQGAIYHPPANPQARLSALSVIAGLLHATLGPNPGALLWFTSATRGGRIIPPVSTAFAHREVHEWQLVSTPALQEVRAVV